MTAGIVELDLHGLNCRQAKIKIDSILRQLNSRKLTSYFKNMDQ